ncbi:glycosyltransferase [Spirillospora sp. CA-294931]|uniref:glycosyltransferase n=1 Tax=Spirillospora sp. CA-294931 TaxID=3240042 RepID=UPI003D94B0A7
MSPTPDRHLVTAVLVAHDGARWLPETLKSLLTQTRPVDRLVTADTGSRDRGPSVLAEVVGESNVLRLARTTGYGSAIASALRHPPASAPVPDGEFETTERTEWVWLLHDDSAPAHDALALLLRVAGTDPNIGVLGCKARDWTDRRVLLELGVAMDGAGRRETGLDRLEYDQGQHDGVREVMAVGSAGMLVRRDVWDDLGGFDLDFGLFRDDADFCWRAQAAGHRVVVVGDAVVHHAEASHRGVREIGATTESRRRVDRRNALYTLLGNLPLLPMARALVRNVWASLVRALLLLVVKRRQAARDELGALGDVLGSPGRLRRVRAARSHGRSRVYRTMRRLQPRRVALRRSVETVAAQLSARARRRGAGRPAEGPGLVRRTLARPPVALVLALTVVAIAAERSLITSGGRLGGGALVPAWGGAGDLWDQYLSGWHPVALGSDAGSPPYIAVLAFLSTLAFGKPWVVVTVLLLGCVPLAGLTAYSAARLLVPEPPRKGRRALRRRVPVTAVRVWFAAVYALLPAATGAIAGGRLGTAVVIVLLPLIAVRAARMFGLPRSAARGRAQADRAAWSAALLLAVAMSFVPLTWPVAVIAGVLLWALFGGKGGRRRLAIALGVPPLLLLPWTVGLLLHPSRFFTEAGLHVEATPAATALDLLALNPGGPGTPARWVMYGLIAAAVCALPLRSRRTATLAGWTLALFGLIVAILVGMAEAGKGTDQAHGWPGVALVFAAAGVLLAATSAVQRAAEVVAGKHPLFQAGGGLILLAAVTAPLLAAATWIADGVDGPIGRVDADAVPRFVQSPEGPRTLVMSREPDGRVSYTVLRGVAPTLGEAETPMNAPARRRLDALVAGLAGGRPGDAQTLTRTGVQYVLVPRPAADPLTRTLDATPELSRLSRTDTFAAWRVPSPSGRLMLLDGASVTPLPAGRTDARVRIPPGTGNRTLLLAEPADGGWRASLDGREVKSRTVDGWAQGYQIPATGGEFELSRAMWLRHTWVAVQGLAVLLVALLALPGADEPVPASVRRRGRRARSAAGSLARRTTSLRIRHDETPAPKETS